MTALNVFPDEAALGATLASEIVDLVEQSSARGDAFLLGCPGGRTPVSTYRAMAAEFARRGTDLSFLVIVMMDDYLQATDAGWAPVPADSHFSCRRFAHHEIQGVFNAGVGQGRAVTDENVWLPDPEAPEDYDRRITNNGGIDFFILASGAGDGHIAFNPPGSTVDSVTRVVELAIQTRRDNLATFPGFSGLDAVPTHGITVGVGTIVAQSKRAAMITIGSDKKLAVQHLLAGSGYDPTWPATVYRLIDGAALYTDAEAASAVS